MKILKTGDTSQLREAWWVGQKVSCTCGTEVVLEVGDGVQERSVRRFKGIRAADLNCPTCGLSIHLKNTTPAKPVIKVRRATKNGAMPQLKGKIKDPLLFEDFQPGAESEASSFPPAPERVQDGSFKNAAHRALETPSSSSRSASAPALPQQQSKVAIAFIGLAVAGLVGLSFLAVRRPNAANPQSPASATASTPKGEPLEMDRAIERIQKTTEKFFAAATVAEMSKHVRHAERVRPLMDGYYAKRPLRPSPMAGQSPIQPVEMLGKGSFWQQTVTFKDGTKATLVLELLETGEAKVDWETMVFLQPIPWGEYAEQTPSGEALDFRVFVQKDGLFLGEFSDNSVWECYQLTSLQSPEKIYGYVKKADPLAAELRALFEKYGSSTPTPILQLRAPLGTQAKRSVLIEKITSSQWIYFDSPSS